MTDNNTKTYQQLEMLIGHDATEKVVAAFRGQELYMYAPDKIDDSHELVQIIGIEAARRMCHYFYGSHLTIPMQRAKNTAERNAEIAQKYKAGTRKSALAKEYNLHVRTVRKIIENYSNEQARAVYARRQLRLFDC